MIDVYLSARRIFQTVFFSRRRKQYKKSLKLGKQSILFPESNDILGKQHLLFSSGPVILKVFIVDEQIMQRIPY